MLPILSHKLHGIQKRELTVVGARTSHGKTAFISQVAVDLAMQDKEVLLLSLEMTKEKIGARIFCLVEHFNNTHAFRGGVNEYPARWEEFKRKTENFPLIITDILGKNWHDIKDMIDQTDLNPDVIILDYIQNISTRGQSKIEGIDEYVGHFREMSIKRNFAAVLCSQVNRSSQDGDSKEPQLHQLKSTGFLEEHADNVLLLSWPYKYTKQDSTVVKNREDYTVYVAKNKDGETGYHKIKYIPEFYLFKEIEKHEEVDKKGWFEQ